jgi:hypothetical protein
LLFLLLEISDVPFSGFERVAVHAGPIVGCAAAVEGVWQSQFEADERLFNHKIHKNTATF